MAKELKQIKGAEIFSAGSWNGLSFTVDDIDAVVRAFDFLGLSGRIPLKLGHEGPDARNDPTTQFAMGWVQRVWRDGERMLADLEVPSRVHELIDDGHLKFVSVELLKNVKAANRVIPWVLDAVALLGSDQPAVGNLKDLRALMKQHSDVPQYEAYELRREFARDDRKEVIRSTNSGDSEEMSDDTKSISEQLLAMSRQLTELEAANRALKKELDDKDQLKARFNTLKGDMEKDRRDRHRASLYAVIDDAVRTEKILPAARETFKKVFRTEDDTIVERVSLEDVSDFIKAHPAPVKPTFKKQGSRATFTLDRMDAELPTTVPADEELTLRVMASLKSKGIHSPNAQQIEAEVPVVFRAFPELAQSWRYLPDNKDAARA